MVREHLGDATLDGVVHSIAYGNPETLLGGNFLDGPWEDVAQAVQVSAYSLKSLAVACQPLMPAGGSIVGLTFDATVAWPAYDWMGVAKAGLESCSRYLARDLGPQGIRVNLVSAGPLRTLAAKAIPGFGDLEDMWKTRAPLGWDNSDHRADRAGRRCAAVRPVPGYDGRDRARGRRLPRDGRLTHEAPPLRSSADNCGDPDNGLLRDPGHQGPPRHDESDLLYDVPRPRPKKSRIDLRGLRSR